MSTFLLFHFLACSVLPFPPFSLLSLNPLLSVIPRVCCRKWGDQARVLCQDFVSILSIENSGFGLAPTWHRLPVSWVQRLPSLAMAPPTLWSPGVLGSKFLSSKALIG